ncbi:hypothetical protein N9F48_03770 [Akkermansiaceae bacterium]|nr:hypothetical protein [Akkermansiaceae bacterium]MDB4300519.1 hypothetical protein [bacterium]MDA7535656.1 hypothetical protein [Akkermansiaceae bacterium]MDA7864077.1 hypothetical protein [Akkermansiaceae bacterium]MDA8969167.1 hypothetical protein [Akkermansiaceae bacterium]
MRATILFGMVCAFGSVGSVAFAADAVEAVAADKIAAHSVSFSGGG